MIDFRFIRTAMSKQKPDGTIRIYGALLDELETLKRGQVLELTDKKGTKFAVIHWDDLCPTDSASQAVTAAQGEKHE